MDYKIQYSGPVSMHWGNFFEETTIDYRIF